MQKNQKGFTLIELLVVIAIIGILSSIVLVSLNSARSKARDAKIKGDMAGINTALVLYSDSGGVFPAHDATTCTTVARCLPALTIDTALDAVMPAGRPKDPVGDDYFYSNALSDATYCMAHNLEGSTNGFFCDSGGCREADTTASPTRCDATNQDEK